jgi:hypothetical protein
MTTWDRGVAFPTPASGFLLQVGQKVPAFMMYKYGVIGKNLTDLEVQQLATFCARDLSPNDFIANRDLIKPAREADIELMVAPTQRISKMTQSKYMDDFFRHGRLQLGTYDYFRSAGNAEVRDHQEGTVTLIGEGPGRTAWGKFQGGGDNYLFCTYLGAPDPKVLRAFEYEACYFIDNPDGFANAIQTSLSANRYSFGKCVYCEEKALVGPLSATHSFERLDYRTVEMIGEAMNFVKPVAYAHQREFRFSWKMPTDVRGALIIDCPEAVQYCSTA